MARTAQTRTALARVSRPAMERRYQAAALPDARPMAQAQSALAALIQQGPRQAAQRQRLDAAFGGLGGSGAPIQLKVTTAGGDWDTTNYAPMGPKMGMFSGEREVGCDIELFFLPDWGSPRNEKIGLIQTVQAVTGQDDDVAPDPTGLEVLPLGERGRTIDRGKDDAEDAGPMNPVYGSDHAGTATTLSGNVKATGENTYGMAHWFKKNRPAKLDDGPTSLAAAGASKIFETAAVVIEGKHAGQYLGSVNWGYTYDGGDAVALQPLTIARHGNPSPQFREQAQRWNDQDHPRRVQIPIP